MTYPNKAMVYLLFFVFCLISPKDTNAGVEAGLVISVTGTLTSKSPEGKIRTLTQKDTVESGDTLYTARDSYARIHFTDGSEVDLRANTHFQIANYHFDENHPEQDRAGLSLLKGSLRARTGLVGKRGNKDSYEMGTPDAIIGVRGTEYGVQVCRGDCEQFKMDDGSAASDGLHSQVDHGIIVVRNKAGELALEEGSFAYVSNDHTMPERVTGHKLFRIELPPAVTKEWEKNTPGRGGAECPSN